MCLQANLPDSSPGQNVTFMLFGDTEIRNNATSVAQQTLTTLDAQISSSLNANVRVGPNSSMATLATISNGTDVVVNGISPDEEWLRIVIPDSETDQLGWISKQLIRTSGDLSTLNVITPGQPQFGPMQAFYLSTGIGAPACNEMPENGLLVQTPKGVGEINLLVNEVEISMGSTVFLSAPRDEEDDGELVNSNSMQIKTIEGAAISRVNGDTTVALGGSQFEVMYNDNGEIAEVSKPKRLEQDEIDDLPYESLEREVELVEALTDKELEILDQYDEVFDLVDIDQTGELLDYLDEVGDADLIDFLQDELGIDYFDGETAAYFEDELGFDIDGYDDYDDYGDGYDDYDDYSDDYDYGGDYDDGGDSY